MDEDWPIGTREALFEYYIPHVARPIRLQALPARLTAGCDTQDACDMSMI